MKGQSVNEIRSFVQWLSKQFGIEEQAEEIGKYVEYFLGGIPSIIADLVGLRECQELCLTLDFN